MKKPRYTLSNVAGAGLTNVFLLAVQSVLFIGLTPLVLKYLGDDAFGVWIILQSIINFSNVANFKLGISTSKFVAQYIDTPDDGRTLNAVISINYIISFLMGAVVVLVLWVIQGWLASSIDSTAIPTESLRIILAFVRASILPLFLSEISIGILFGLLRYGIGNSILLGQQTLLWAGVLLIGWLQIDFVYFGLLVFSVMFLRFLIAALFVIRIVRPKLVFNPARHDRNLFREIFDFTRMNWLGAVGMLLFNFLDKVVVGIVLGPAVAGVYGIATGISLRLSQLIDQATQALIPYASNPGNSKDPLQIVGVYRSAQQMSAIMIALVSTTLVIWMPQILVLWISPEFSADYAHLFRIILLAYSLYALFTPAYKIATGLGWVRIPNLVILATAIVMIIVLTVASRALGLTGAIFSNFIFTGLLLINLYLANRLGENAVRFLIRSAWLPILLLGLFSWIAVRTHNLLHSVLLFVVFLIILLLSQRSFILPVLLGIRKSLAAIIETQRGLK